MALHRACRKVDQPKWIWTDTVQPDTVQPQATTGGSHFFFTLATSKRQPVLCRTHEIQLLRAAFRFAMDRRPFNLSAICVLPDHLHCIWELPAGDCDHATRWRLLHSWFAKYYRGGSVVWQPDYCERALQGTEELDWHLDYVHFDPVKHGLASRAAQWPWSSFHAYVKRGLYPPHWGEHIEMNDTSGERWL